ncbi:glycosyltransferase family 4 protein [Agaribacterium sp. ZY112]|uniref:glycosyltransferase family 4 protein n=1 Tax=Agaribacterium sp. ZY112 TaxID=3233574 RepID=UPI003525EF23
MPAAHPVCLVLDSARYGGIEAHVAQLASGLNANRIAVLVVFLNDYRERVGPHPLIDFLEKEQLDYKVLDGRFSSLKRLIKTLPVLLCHAHGYKAGIYSRMACLKHQTPCITTYHAGEKPKGKLKLYDLIDRVTARLNTHSTAVSEEIARRVYGPCHQLNNFINVDNVKPSGGNKIGFVGRLSEEKAPQTFVSLAASFPDYQFDLFGDGPLRESLEQNLSANCQLHGHVNMEQHWQRLEYLVICSRFEGLPLCLLEAMARGIIVISYDLGQIGKVIQNEINGFIVQTGNPSQLKSTLNKALLLDQQQKDEIRKQAIQSIYQHYSRQAVLPQYVSQYQVSLNKHASKPQQTKGSNAKGSNAIKLLNPANSTTPLNPDIANMPTATNQSKQGITVLFVHFGEDWIRGSEVCLINLVSSIHKYNVTPIVWCNSKTLKKELIKRGISVIQQPFTVLLGWEKPKFNLSGFFKQIKQGAILIKEHRIDVVHSNGGAPNQWMLIAARKTSTPIVTQLHAPYIARDRATLSLRDPDIIVGVSQAVIEPFLSPYKRPKALNRKSGSQIREPLLYEKKNHQGDNGCSKAKSTKTNKYRVIYNGIDLSKYSEAQTSQLNIRNKLGIKHDSFVIASVGSLIHRKGFDLLIKAVYRLRSEEKVNAELIIIGDGEESNKLKKLCSTLKLTPYIHFLGERNDVNQILSSNIDVFASGARDEAFGLVLAEAGAAGLAAVAPAVGGIAEVIEHDKSGLLVAPNSHKELSHSLLKLHRYPALRKKMGTYAKTRCFSQFSLERNTQNFYVIYKSLHTQYQKPSLVERIHTYLSPLISIINLKLTRLLEG